MSDSSNDRSPKPPRTLFSLGRPGAKKPGDTAIAADSPSGGGDEEYELLCGACAAPLIGDAAFCGSCGTPVAFEDGDEVPGQAAEPVVAGAEPEPDPEPVAAAPFVPEPEPEPEAFVPEVEPAVESIPEQMAPAAVLYHDPSQPEPLPPSPEGSWGISEPTYGGSDTDFGDSVPTDEPLSVDAEQESIGHDIPDADQEFAVRFPTGLLTSLLIC